MYNNKIRIPLLIGILILATLDLSGVIQVPGIVIFLIIIALLWYNIRVRTNRHHSPNRTKKR